MQDSMASNRFGIPVIHMFSEKYDGYTSKSQVPGSSGSDTLTCLTLHSKASKVIDAAICWNYMVPTIYLHLVPFLMHKFEVVAEPEGITKYGLINNRPGQVIKFALCKILLRLCT